MSQLANKDICMYTGGIAVFGPPNLTHIWQPADFGVIATFKARYLQLVDEDFREPKENESKRDRIFRLARAAWDSIERDIIVAS
jgi:hypothetical protein